MRPRPGAAAALVEAGTIRRSSDGYRSWMNAGHADIPLISLWRYMRHRGARSGRQPRTSHTHFRMSATRSAEIGRPMRAPSGREADLEGRMVFAGGPEQVAAGVVHLHKALGHSRQILQMDVGGMPHETFLKSIELLGKKVLPRDCQQLKLTGPTLRSRCPRSRHTDEPVRKSSRTPTQFDLVVPFVRGNDLPVHFEPPSDPSGHLRES